MKNNGMLIRTLILFAVVVLMVFSCKKEQNTLPETNNANLQNPLMEEQFEGEIILGEQLPNPYTVENMAEAFENIKNSFPEVVSPVRTTHHYVKFSIQNEEQLSFLKQDTNLVVYPYPMDYEIVGNGTFYNSENGQCDSCIGAQFSTIKVNQTFASEISLETLANLYIPEEDDLRNYASASVDIDYFEEQLILEAFRLVGLSIETNPGYEVQKVSSSKWRPKGKIRVWDDIKNDYIAIEGVMVRARRWFTTHKGLSDQNGNYSCDGEFRYDANYSIQWDRQDFSIRSGTLGQACYNGPKKKGDWNLDINTNPQMFYARVFRATCQYYYKDIDGLTRPPLNTFWRPQLKIAAYNEDNEEINGNAAAPRRFLGLGNFIKLYNPTRSISDIHGTTIHELAHAAHWEISNPKSNFNGGDDIVVESWARGVQWWLTSKLYTSYMPYYSTPYTGVVQDMIDGTSGYDQVTGYTIAEIEQSVKNKKTWSDLKSNIKNLYNNATEGNLDNLFDFWD